MVSGHGELEFRGERLLRGCSEDEKPALQKKPSEEDGKPVLQKERLERAEPPDEPSVSGVKVTALLSALAALAILSWSSRHLLKRRAQKRPTVSLYGSQVVAAADNAAADATSTLDELPAETWTEAEYSQRQFVSQGHL